MADISTTVHVSRAQTLLVYFNMVSYGGHNSGAKALTDHPYSVILKGAKNTETNGRVNVSQFRPADPRPKPEREYSPCLGTGGILKYIIQWPQGITVHVSRAQTLLMYFNMLYSGNTMLAIRYHPCYTVLNE